MVKILRCPFFLKAFFKKNNIKLLKLYQNHPTFTSSTLILFKKNLSHTVSTLKANIAL